MHTKKFWTFVIVILLLAGFSIFSFVRNIYFSKNLHENIISGKVVAKRENSLQIEDIRMENKNIFVDENTEIRKGREFLNFTNLATGTFLLMELDKQEKNFDKALKIRIIDPEKNPFRKPNDN